MVEKKSPVAAVKAEEKKTSVDAVKATVNTGKAEEVKKAAPKAAAKTEEKETVKKAAVKKAVEKKPVEKKAAEKKPAPKKESVKKTEESQAEEIKEPAVSFILQYAGKEVQADEWSRKAKEIWKSEGRDEAELREIKLYVKPEENMVYYVINGDETGSFEL